MNKKVFILEMVFPDDADEIGAYLISKELIEEAKDIADDVLANFYEGEDKWNGMTVPEAVEAAWSEAGIPFEEIETEVSRIFI